MAKMLILIFFLTFGNNSKVIHLGTSQFQDPMVDSFWDQVDDYESHINNNSTIPTQFEQDGLANQNTLFEFRNNSSYNTMEYSVLGMNDDLVTVMNQTSTIYEIRYDFDLRGATIHVGANSVLKFVGGVFRNGTIVGNNTKIESPSVQIFGPSLTLSGTFNVVGFVVDWFGAVADYDANINMGTDSSPFINKAIKSAESCGVHKILFNDAKYYVSNPIVINKGDIEIEGAYGYKNEGAFYLETQIPYNGIYSNSSYCFKIGNAVNKPVSFTHLNITNPFTINHNYSSIGIFYNSNYGGPNWPFVVNNCHFSGYNKAIYFDSVNDYMVGWVYIEHCAFINNNICIQMADSATSGRRKKFSNGFTFSHNKAHGNSGILDIGCTWSPCNIIDNNLEGINTDAPSGMGDAIDHCSIVNICNTSLYFHDNYFESIGKPIAKFQSDYGNAYIHIANNSCIELGTSPNNLIKIYGDAYAVQEGRREEKIFQQGRPFVWDNYTYVIDHDIVAEYSDYGYMPHNSTLVFRNGAKISGKLLRVSENDTLVLPTYNAMVDGGYEGLGGCPAKGTIYIKNGICLISNGEEWLEPDGEKEGVLRYGPFDNKPTPNNIGFRYFNTDTKRVIIWSGTKWYNPDGEEAFY